MNDTIESSPTVLDNTIGGASVKEITTPTSRRGGGRLRKAVQRPEIAETDIRDAVQSLYEDELKPYGRILRKRLLDQGKVLGLGSNEAGLAHLRAACEPMKDLRIEPAQGGEWVALLVNKHVEFVDVYSPVDVYPRDLWAQASVYFDQLDDAECVFPSGRFSCAACLMDRKLPFLAGYSLGKVCHIVQLAISQKKLLGYGNLGVVPYARSQSKVKDQAACQKAMLSPGDDPGSENAFATWRSLRRHMIDILGLDVNPAGEPVPLSNIKRLFRIKFNIEVSETALGHSKLSELFLDERLGDICTVRLLETGYFVVPSDKPSMDSPSRGRGDDESEGTSPYSRAGDFDNAGIELPLIFQHFGFAVRKTFIDLVPSVSTDSTLRRAQSCPRHLEGFCSLSI